MCFLLHYDVITASNVTFTKAEHMRCFLLDWMTLLEGSFGCSGVPEIRDRQSIGVWTSASDSGVVEMGKKV
jgi:hypothetical protein